jgi:hypothetical protein
MDQDQIKVQTFDLSDINAKAEYEKILNAHEKIKEEFAYMRDGTPKVTIWYAVTKDK